MRGTVRSPSKSSAVIGVAAIGVAPILALAPPAVAAPPPPGACSTSALPLSTFQNPLPVLPAANLTASATVSATQTLYEVPGRHEFDPAGQPGKRTASWAYSIVSAGGVGQNDYLGPVLVAKRGVPVDLTVVNQLGGVLAPQGVYDGAIMHAAAGSTAVHLHGGHTDIASDGGPYDVFGNNASHVYHFVNDQEAAGIWYHDHALGNTRLNVLSGLAGGYVIRDAFDTGAAGNPEGLPAGYGSYELPLLLQDRTFDASMAICYPGQAAPPAGAQYPYTTPAGGGWIPEYFGDTAVVNGRVRPYLNVEPAVYRYRLYNGSQARFYNLSLKLAAGTGSALMYQIGDSGGLLNAPVRMQSLLLAPGQRADVLVDFTKASAGAKFTLSNDAVAPYPNGPRAAARGGAPVPNVMQFQVTGVAGSGATRTIPTTLRGGPGRPPAIGAAQACTPPTCVVRNIFLNEVLDAAGTPVRVSVNNIPFDSADGSRNAQIVTQKADGTVTTLDQVPSNGSAPVETPRVNTVEQWNFINTTMDSHPMHLHMVHFRLIGREQLDSAGYLGLLSSTLAKAGYTDPLPTWTGTLGTPAPTNAAMHGPWPAPSADRFTRGGLKAAAANEAGWMDTVIVPPGQITRVLVPFGGDGQGVISGAAQSWAQTNFGARYNRSGTLPAGEAPYSGSFVNGTEEPYVYHCHILEHEENDMMLSYRVTGTP